MPLSDLTDTERAILAELLQETIAAESLPAVAARPQLEGDPREARSGGGRADSHPVPGAAASGNAGSGLSENAGRPAAAMTLQPEADPDDAETIAAFMRDRTDADLVQIINAPRVLIGRLPGFTRYHLRTPAEPVVVALADSERQRRQFERQQRISRTAMWAAWGSAIAGLAAAFAGIVNARDAIMGVLHSMW